MYLKFHPRLLYFLFLVSFARINSKRVAWLECCEYWPPEPCNSKHWSQYSMFVWKYSTRSFLVEFLWIEHTITFYAIFSLLLQKSVWSGTLQQFCSRCKFIRVNRNPFLQKRNFVYLPICNVELLEHLGRCSIDGYLLQEVVLTRAIKKIRSYFIKRSGDPMSQDQTKTSVCKLVSNDGLWKRYVQSTWD